MTMLGQNITLCHFVSLCGTLVALIRLRAQDEKQSVVQLMIEIRQPAGLKNVEMNYSSTSFHNNVVFLLCELHRPPLTTTTCHLGHSKALMMGFHVHLTC